MKLKFKAILLTLLLFVTLVFLLLIYSSNQIIDLLERSARRPFQDPAGEIAANNGVFLAQNGVNNNVSLDSVADNPDLTNGDQLTTVYNLSLPVDKNFKCRRFSFIHNQEFDSTLCPYQETTGDLEFSDNSWDKAKEWVRHKKIFAVFRTDSSLGLIDIGAYVGEKTLFVLKMNRKVVAVEPYLESVKRIHKAIRIANLQKCVTLLHNSISDTRTRMTVRTAGKDKADTIAIKHPTQETCDGHCEHQVNSILLDDLVNLVPFKKAVMIIDIVGSELLALTAAKKLFAAIDIPFIFMKWNFQQMKYVYDINHSHRVGSDISALATGVFQFLLAQGYTPYYSPMGPYRTPLDLKHWTKWDQDVVWTKNISDTYNMNKIIA